MGSLFIRSNVWYGVFCVNGKRVWRSMLIRDAGEAKRRFEEVAKEFVSWQRMTVLDFRKQLIGKILPGDVSPSSSSLYDYAFRRFAGIIGNRLLREITPYHVDVYKSERLTQVSPTRVHIEFRTLRAAFNRAVKFKMLDSNPFVVCSNVRVPVTRPHFLSKAEFHKLLQVVDNEQMRSIIILAVLTGMRRGEIVALRWENVDLIRGFIHLENQVDFQLKGRKPRSVPLNKEVI
ncbi:MAG: tyrosine-type recombinase/integrase, partial [Ignavibacteria bacterium]|nr:tyrosine-type recombinase/integrase [Ignavibacteria bacterium]